MTAHLHRLPTGPVDLTAIRSDATPGFDGGKRASTKGRLLLDHLQGLGLRWPPADFDAEEQRRRLLEESPVA